MAVILVVLYHAGVPRLTGGFVGVDVFFVISGFVITGLLLRERISSHRTSVLDFYARRVRRILPAATLVILIAVVFSYVLLGFISGNAVANDGRWAAVFLSNFHFQAVGTNYFTASRPPSPLQNFWSLSVEEQFYVVYPTLFLVIAKMRGRWSFEARMAFSLCGVIVASYWLSVTQTVSQPIAAYFSPLTRAWELALGALVAVASTWLRRIPAKGAALLTWTGLAAILVAAFDFGAQTTYPGSLVAVPVVGAALVIAGGLAVPRAGAEWLLGQAPVRMAGSAVVLALSVALANPHHRRRTCREDQTSNRGEPPPRTHRVGSVNGDVQDHREPCASLAPSLEAERLDGARIGDRDTRDPFCHDRGELRTPGVFGGSCGQHDRCP